MPLPQFYEAHGEEAATEISFFVALFHSDDSFGLALMVIIAVLQLLALIPLYRQPSLVSVVLFFFGSFAYVLIGIAALLLRIARATQNLNGLYDGPPFPHQLIHAECVGAIGAALSFCFLLIGSTFYVFRWRHSVPITTSHANVT